MIRDVFYFGDKPNVHPRERYATSIDDARQQCTTEHFWIVNELCDYRNFDWDFDFEFLPDEDVWAENHNNVWPSQHQKDSGTWLCSKIHSDIIIYRADVEPVYRKNIKTSKWVIPDNIDVSNFDFSWHPDPTSPPYIYQFASKLYNNDGPRYICENNDGTIVTLPRIEITESVFKVGQYYITTTLYDLVQEHKDEVFWALNKNIDYTNFNFDWRPQTIQVAYELNYVHVFGSYDSEMTQTYFVSAKHYLEGNTDYKFVEDIELSEQTLHELFVKPDMFFVDHGNINSEERYQILKDKFGDKIQKTRYLNSYVDTINRCIKKASTQLVYILNSELDYTDFDFNYYPNPWQMKMVSVFGTQHSHWGTTFLVNTETFGTDTKYIKVIEHLSNLNFVKHIRATATECIYDVVLIDYGNKETTDVVKLIQDKTNKHVNVYSYDNSYLKTIKNIVDSQIEKKDHYLYICSSVCDYNNFDFSYIVDPFAKEQLHVFPSNSQKFGDTFFIDVNKARTLLKDLYKLEDYDKINFNSSVKANRLTEPKLVVEDDTHVNSLTISDFPYATLTTVDNVDLGNIYIEPMNLWSIDTKNILVTSTGATRIVVPNEAKTYVKKELYDYPYIKRLPNMIHSKPIDIVFLSNGETLADENYEHLLEVTKNLKNRVVRVDGVNGRVASYHAAVMASETPWCFTVFAKLKVNEKFDFNWQPDRLQVPKHYIFHAKNPVNGLVYGHQAMIAYNKKLVLNNTGIGLDFTLDDEHEVVPLVSGVANYNTDMFSTWRTAFREVIKLKDDDSHDSKYRLHVWMTKAEGQYGEYSIKGAMDADRYYDEVNGDFDKLKLSYEWEWLKNKFDSLGS